MSFTSPVFLFAFLPLTVIVYQLARSTKLKNAVWIAAGLLFYAFGDLRHLPLLLGSCLLHYGAGRYLMARTKARRAVLLSCVALDLAVLAFYKVRGTLPLGISFYTFQAISYVADTYKNPADGTKNLREALQYLTFFPQLTAGPFLKFSALRPYLDRRDVSWEKNAQGVRRFVCGLCKKVLLSTAAAKLADAMFSLASIDALGAWTGALGYCLQLYFDFSGYSDMALGLGLLFGVQLPENFRHPYCAGSVSEFWRRWHMTLSGWFRDYVYIPLGGSRNGRARTVFNKLLVFLATGLWHGTGWTFVLWGLWHGLFSVLEDCGAIPVDKLKGKRIGQLYTLLVVVLGFTLFRADTLAQAGAMYAAMFSGVGLHWLGTAAVWAKFTPAFALTLCLALLLCTPVAREHTPKRESVTFIGALGLLLLCMMYLAAGSFNPFIYFRF